jgi:hypothetical protein
MQMPHDARPTRKRVRRRRFGPRRRRFIELELDEDDDDVPVGGGPADDKPPQ